MKLIDSSEQQPSIISFLKDLPNICSLVGLGCTILGVYLAIIGQFSMAMVCALWAVVFDWADGIIARSLSGRKDYQKQFGGQLDSLIDIVNFGVFPAVFLMSYGGFNPWFLIGAFLIVGSCAIRLSYFNIFGLCDDNTYIGMALDNNIIILAFIFLFERFVEHTIFSILIYILLMILMVLNVAPIKTPKFTGKWFYILIVYSLVLTVLFSWKQFS